MLRDWLDGAGEGASLSEIEDAAEFGELLVNAGVCVIGCDAANGRYFQLYSDDRNVCRVYEMSIGDGEWRLWREGEPFAQRFTATISDDGNTIDGRWELNEGDGWRTDFELTYRRVS